MPALSLRWILETAVGHYHLLISDQKLLTGSRLSTRETAQYNHILGGSVPCYAILPLWMTGKMDMRRHLVIAATAL